MGAWGMPCGALEGGCHGLARPDCRPSARPLCRAWASGRPHRQGARAPCLAHRQLGAARGLFSGRAVCRRSARQPASLMAGRTSGQEATCPSSRRPEPGLAAEPPRSSDSLRSAASPVGLPGARLLPPLDSQGRACLPRVLVSAPRPWGWPPRPCLAQLLPAGGVGEGNDGAVRCWRQAQCPPGGPPSSSLSVMGTRPPAAWHLRGHGGAVCSQAMFPQVSEGWDYRLPARHGQGCEVMTWD